jgi:hypothetical protein
MVALNLWLALLQQIRILTNLCIPVTDLPFLSFTSGGLINNILAPPYVTKHHADKVHF